MTTFKPKSKHVGRGRDSDNCPACQELIAESKRGSNPDGSTSMADVARIRDEARANSKVLKGQKEGAA